MSPRPRILDTNYNRVKKSKKHENRIASAIGGHRLPRSGGMSPSKWAKGVTADGDISSKDFLVEHKSTENASISLKLEWLNKVSEGANRSNKDPMVVITFAQGLRQTDDWVLLPSSVFERLRRRG